MKHEHVIDQGFVVSQHPGRLATLESDLAVPVGQALAVGLAVGLAAGVGALLLGPAVAGLDGAALWTWAARLALFVAAVTLAIAVVVFVGQARKALLGQLERWVGRDLDGDGQVGNVPAPHVKVTLVGPGKGQQRFIDLPVALDELRAVAVAVLRDGRPFSRAGLAGVVSQSHYARLAQAMIKRGLLVALPGNKRRLSLAGRAVLARLLE